MLEAEFAGNFKLHRKRIKTSVSKINFALENIVVTDFRTLFDIHLTHWSLGDATVILNQEFSNSWIDILNISYKIA